MQLRLYLDEDSMSKALAHNLRLRSIDVTKKGAKAYLIWNNWNLRHPKVA